MFQVLIRRHHRLKADRKIWGNSLECIEELIKTYCRRHRYEKWVEEELLNNYVASCKISSQENTLKIKNSLRLNKLSYKNIGHSITLYGNDSEKR